MKSMEYQAPCLRKCFVCCERGFSLSGGGFNPGIGDWDDGENIEGGI